MLALIIQQWLESKSAPSKKISPINKIIIKKNINNAQMDQRICVEVLKTFGKNSLNKFLM